MLWSRWARAFSRAQQGKGGGRINFTDDATIQQLNKDYRGSTPRLMLSFALEEGSAVPLDYGEEDLPRSYWATSSSLSPAPKNKRAPTDMP